jgi:hypothetical protein
MSNGGSSIEIIDQSHGDYDVHTYEQTMITWWTGITRSAVMEEIILCLFYFILKNSE